jgi:hypothetical protein
MQRPTYGQPPPAHSPPLHHPVPQHVSTVPQLRSPPPPVSSQSQQSGYGNPYQPQAPAGGASNAFGAYGGFMNDQTAQMGFQVGQTAFKHGQEYVEQNVGIQSAVAMAFTSSTDSELDWKICQCLRAEALLQRVKRLCCQQTISCPFSLETQTLVPKAVYWS